MKKYRAPAKIYSALSTLLAIVESSNKPNTVIKGNHCWIEWLIQGYNTSFQCKYAIWYRPFTYYINCAALSGTKSVASDKRKSYDFFFHSIKIVVLRQEVWFAVSISRSLSIHWAPDTDDAIQSAQTILTMNAYVALQSCDKAKHLLLKNTRTSVLLSKAWSQMYFQTLKKNKWKFCRRPASLKN